MATPELVAARRAYYAAACRMVFEGASRREVERLRCKVIRLKGTGARRVRRGAKGAKGGNGMAWKILAMPPKPDAVPALSLSTTGRLTWTEALGRAMGEPQQVNILYDADTNRLGIQPGDGAGAVTVRAGRSVTICKLLKVAGIWSELALPMRLVPASLDEEAGVWAVSLEGVRG